MRIVKEGRPARGWILWLPIFALAASASPGFAAGEPVNGFPGWYERMVHVLTNRARCDPAAALVDCSPCADVDLGCYDPVPPVQWHEDLNRAARFHAVNLADSGCGLMHNSPCQLDPDIGSTYPDLCDGSVSCACASAVTCAGDSPWERLALFGVSAGYRGENIAFYLGNPFSVMDLWLLESLTTPTCDYHCAAYDDCNGHRQNILNAGFTRLGVGSVGGGAVVQDFWGGGPVDQKIPSAAHYPQNGGPTTDFRVNWYDDAPPGAALVNIDGQCFPMSLERGSGANGTYLYTAATSTGSRYYFEFRDAADQPVTYPETGSFGIGGADWEATRPDPCGASAVGDGAPRPASLEPNYPNPFNPATTIAFRLPAAATVSLRIHDAAGRLVDVLLDGAAAGAGRTEVVWRGRDRLGRALPSGTYFCRLEAGGHVQTRRMTLLR